MKITTWDLKVGDKIKLYYTPGDRYDVLEIKEEPEELFLLGVLTVILENNVVAKFNEEKQRWEETAFKNIIRG